MERGEKTITVKVNGKIKWPKGALVRPKDPREYLAKLREYRTAIVNNENLTGEQKREKVDQIEKMEVLVLSQLNLPALRKLAGL